MDVIKRNFFSLLRCGAFDEVGAVEPMSPFKWRRLLQMVDAQNVLPVFTSGVRKNADNDMLNLPDDIVKVVKNASTEPPSDSTAQIERNAHLSNGFYNRRLKKIVYNERHSIDTSIETIFLLHIIVFNVTSMLNHGLSMDGIIRLGQYLRTKGDKVDFVKLDTWLSALHMQRMAQLQGSILMEVFGFEKDELPFVDHEEKSTRKLTFLSVTNLVKDTAKVWHFRQRQSGFVVNNSAVLRRNLRRSFRYLKFAPLETMSNFVTNFVRSLQEIEE